MKQKLSFEKWCEKVVKESKHYPLLRRCNGEFNERMLKENYGAGKSPIELCNAMVEVS